MYFNLALSVICSTFLFVSFKLFARFGINNFHGLVLNYWTAAALAFLMNVKSNNEQLYEIPKFLPATLIIGLMFISVFFVTAITTQKLGLAVASVAAKMSVVIPVTAGVILYKEQLNWIHIVGILIALTAVYFTGSHPTEENKKLRLNDFLLPVILFIGTGMVDASIKFAQHTFMNDENRNVVIMCLFASAGLFGLIKLIFNYFRRRENIRLKSIIGGICLGIFNYFSLYFLLNCLESTGAQSAIIFALLNIGIVLLSSVLALLMFKEKLNAKNYIGIGLAVIAIVILAK